MIPHADAGDWRSTAYPCTIHAGLGTASRWAQMDEWLRAVQARTQASTSDNQETSQLGRNAFVAQNLKAHVIALEDFDNNFLL